MAEPLITDVRYQDDSADLRRYVYARFDDGQERRLFGFYADEISLSPQELTGMTEAQARELYFGRDRRYLQS